MIKYHYNEDLREIPEDSSAMAEHVRELKAKKDSDVAEQVRRLGVIGTYLRILNQLDEAEKTLRKALQLIDQHSLGFAMEVQQKLRLAHVLQWQRRFGESDKLFNEVMQKCRTDMAARLLLDFAIQHAGKNLFDQQRYAEALPLFEEALRLRREREAPPDQIQSTEQAIARTIELMTAH